MGKIRVKGQRSLQRERDFSPSYQMPQYDRIDILPQIGPDDPFADIVRKLSM